MWLVYAVSANQDHNAISKPTQTNQPLLAVRMAGILACKHWRFERRFSLGKIDPMLALVGSTFRRVIRHFNNYCICS